MFRAKKSPWPHFNVRHDAVWIFKSKCAEPEKIIKTVHIEPRRPLSAPGFSPTSPPGAAIRKFFHPPSKSPRVESDWLSFGSCYSPEPIATVRGSNYLIG